MQAADEVTVVATIVSVRAGPRGARMITHYEGHKDGRVIWTTREGLVFRGVTTDGPDATLPGMSTGPSWAGDKPPPHTNAQRLDLPSGLAHVYAECARIHNPIHTDMATADLVGLERPVLHGTATLGACVQAIASKLDPSRIRRIAARFTGLVSLPERLTLSTARRSDQVLFRACTADGTTVIRDGLVQVAPGP